MGPAGSGKGTMSKKITAEYNIPHVSTGDMFREALKKQTMLGRIAQGYMDEGKLVPDEVTIAMLEERFTVMGVEEGYLLDGFPRTLPQAEALDELTNRLSCEVEVVIDLTVDFEDLAKRITGRRVCSHCGEIYHVEFSPSKVEGICDKCNHTLTQRADDTREQLQIRLAEHNRNTAPVLDYYESKGLVKKVNASLAIDDVWNSVQEILENLR